MAGRTIGVIGGSGLYDMPGLGDVERIRMRTPFGDPSDALVAGTLGDARLVFLPRHGAGHRLLPTEVNSRANIWALKQLGCGWVISVSAVGSMKEQIRPGDAVVPEQFVDRTWNRPSTFFGDGLVAHVSFADPVCPRLSQVLIDAARAANAPAVHKGGAYLCIEGPNFSTKAESRVYRSWGVDVIGMTGLPEARLAREAELCYATLALPTDYDCWHEGVEPVTVEAVLAQLERNVALGQAVIREAAQRIPLERACACPSALKGAIMTQPESVPASVRRRLELLVGRYLPPAPKRKGVKKRAAARVGRSRP